MLWGERRGNGTIVLQTNRSRCRMPQANDLSRCLTALDQGSTLIAVIEMSQSRWLVAGIVPGIERHPAKKREPNAVDLLRLLQPPGQARGPKGHGGPKRSAAGGRSAGLRLLSRPAATASGWPAGCGRTMSKPK